MNKTNDEKIKIGGLVENIIYSNDDNGYTVCELDIDGELVTAVGEMPYLSEGESINAMGVWIMHPRHGRQFKVESYEKELPVTSVAILKYLSSRAIKGIGPITAAKIVEKFGDETFDVIENTPEMLCDIRGISRSKALEISASFKEQFGIRNVIMFCRDYFSPATAVKIYQRWGGSSIDVIKSNPYLLCSEVNGIGFDKADKIASFIGLAQNSPDRIMAGLKYILLSSSLKDGHVCIPESRLGQIASSLLGIECDEVCTPVERLVESGELVRKTIRGRQYIYLKKYFEDEQFIARKLMLLDKMCSKISLNDISRFILTVEMEEGIQYAAMQRRAIEMALTRGVMILTGGPGTGKTTVIRAVMRVFEKTGMSITLAAPTGRAAKRMSEVTQYEAKTIHRLLEMSYESNGFSEFRRNEHEQLEEDVIIIDEMSMVDVSLMSALLKAIKPGARLILIGDANQLPSVGPGNVLNDIINSGYFNTVELKEIFRQAGESMIVTNSHMIINGEYPKITAKSGDFFFIPRENGDLISKTICDLCLNRLPKKYGEKIKNGIQVISPSRKGAAGTELLNVSLQSYLNPPSADKPEIKVRSVIFRTGDKIMQIKNNYDMEWTNEDISGVGVFNGDIGVIEEINFRKECVVVSFDERRAEYDFTQLDELEHAYAVTVHKSQGNEYPVVIMPMYRFAPMLLTRNLFYTAVTRAQEMVILVGISDVIMTMVDNNKQAKRYTGLNEMVKELYADN